MTVILYTPTEAAQYLKVPASTMAFWRSSGKGPKFLKVGRHVRYTAEAVEEYLTKLANA